MTIENDIYNPDKISKSNSKDPLVITYANLRDNLATNEKTKTERVRFINEFRWAIVDAWMRAIKDANLNSESHEEKEKSYWISPKKLSVQIQDAITAKKTDSPDNKGTFVLKNVQYSQLPGGLYGQLHTGSLHPKGLPQFLSGIGNPSPESKIEPQWIVGGDTIHLPVKTSIVPIVHFTMKKDKDDITSTSPSLAGEDVFSKTEFIDVKLVKSTSKDILSMPHPNAKNAVTSGNKKAFIPINDNDLDSIFKNLGIAEENSKMREAIQVHKETKENIK
ncbi:MAG: hypothetical protein JWQ35_828 [Bacteriovoracaceae bacterium]|nr:hypothetical protein [Bacteriovoracaceae bacterium]